MSRPSFDAAPESDDAESLGSDVRLGQNALYEKLSRFAPDPVDDLKDLALDAIFGQGAPSPASPAITPQADERSEPTFADLLDTRDNRAGAPANDDRIDLLGTGSGPLYQLTNRLRRTLRLLVATSLLLVASGVVAQLGPASAIWYAKIGLWASVLVDLLLVTSFLFGLTNLMEEAHRRQGIARRDDADRAARRDAEGLVANDLIRTRTEEMVSDLASLRAQCAELAAMPRLEPAFFDLFSRKTDAQFARLSARLSAQSDVDAEFRDRVAARIDELVIVEEQTREIAHEMAGLRCVIQELAAMPKLEASHLEPLLETFEFSTTTQADVARSMEELRLAIEALPATLTRAGVEARTLPNPKATQAMAEQLNRQEQVGALEAEAFCEALAAFLGSAATDERRSLEQGVRSTLDVMFDLDALVRAWNDYRTYGEADFSSIYRDSFEDHMRVVRRRLADPGFVRSVEAFLDGHEEALKSAARSGSEAELLRQLWSTDGRCYTLLAHAYRRISSIDNA